MSSCEGVCYTCRNKDTCECRGNYNLKTCTKIATNFHVMNRGHPQCEYTLKLCKQCSWRGLWALNNSYDYMGTAQSIK